MRSNAAHLTDDQLLDLHLLGGATTGSEHVASCAACGERLSRVALELDALREAAVAEADEIFSADRLDEQQSRIIRRLERLGHPAEVLRFPNRFGAARGTRRLGSVRRWVAGAAVAGLVAGVLLGFAVDRRVAATTAARRLPVGPVAVMQAGVNPASSRQDEQMLNEIEEVISRSGERIRPLRSLDDMTTPAEIQEASLASQ